MILLVPIAPEVPPVHARQLWPGLVLVILLCLGYLEVVGTIDADTRFVDDLYSMDSVGKTKIKDGDQLYNLKLRPLLKIAPAPGDWNLERVFYANFIHGSPL